jgi:hypothetical protein
VSSYCCIWGALIQYEYVSSYSYFLQQQQQQQQQQQCIYEDRPHTDISGGLILHYMSAALPPAAAASAAAAAAAGTAVYIAVEDDIREYEDGSMRLSLIYRSLSLIHSSMRRKYALVSDI